MAPMGQAIRSMAFNKDSTLFVFGHEAKWHHRDDVIDSDHWPDCPPRQKSCCLLQFLVLVYAMYSENDKGKVVWVKRSALSGPAWTRGESLRAARVSGRTQSRCRLLACSDWAGSVDCASACRGHARRCWVSGTRRYAVCGDCDVPSFGRYAGGENKNERAEAAGTSGKTRKGDGQRGTCFGFLMLT